VQVSDPIRLAIIDDHPIFRVGIVRSLDRAESIRIVAEGTSAADAIAIAAGHAPDVMLLDISIPGDGLAAAREVKQRWPNIKVIMLTVSESEDHLAKALDSGASGYILKGVVATELVRTVLAVHAGESYVTPHLAGRVLFRQLHNTPLAKPPDDRLTELTPEEEAILALVTAGRSNKEIARESGMTERAIKNVVSRIMKKLQVRNRVEAAVAGIRSSKDRAGK
jgi:two-component system, NarL family, nitrate/nitrite response regulator NarL